MIIFLKDDYFVQSKLFLPRNIMGIYDKYNDLAKKTYTKYEGNIFCMICLFTLIFFVLAVIFCFIYNLDVSPCKPSDEKCENKHDKEQGGNLIMTIVFAVFAVSGFVYLKTYEKSVATE